MKEASLLFCLPDNPFFLPKSLGTNAVQEATYACPFLIFLIPAKKFSDNSLLPRLWLDLRPTFLQPTRTCIPSAEERAERE